MQVEASSTNQEGVITHSSTGPGTTPGTEHWEREAGFKPQTLFGFHWTQKALDPSPGSQRSVVITDHDSRTALENKAWPEAHTVCFAPVTNSP